MKPVPPYRKGSQMNTVNLDATPRMDLPKRQVHVLVGGDSVLQSSQLTFGVTTVTPRCAMDSHSHLQEEIIFIMSGRGHVEIDGANEELRAGTAILLRSGCSHAVYNDSDEEMRFTFCFHPPVRVGSYDRK